MNGSVLGGRYGRGTDRRRRDGRGLPRRRPGPRPYRRHQGAPAPVRPGRGLRRALPAGGPGGGAAEPPEHRRRLRLRCRRRDAVHRAWSSSRGGRSRTSWRRGGRPRWCTPRDGAEDLRRARGGARAGVIHRDIKPATSWSRARRRKGHGLRHRAHHHRAETAPQTSAVLGTATYLSPEQAQGGPVDGGADIYSLGAVLTRCWTGSRPSQASSPSPSPTSR